MNPALAPRLREALQQAGYTYDGVAGLLGTRAHDALARNETTPARRVTGGGSPLETLVRLFLLQDAVPAAQAERALPGLVEPLAVTGLLDTEVGEVRARLDCRPYATDDEHLWVVSDLTPGLDGGPQHVTADHVLGISAASTSLAQLTIRDDVGRALDLGTGCGVQALHLARHAGEVVATDVNRRALDVTRFNAALNDVVLDVRDGSFYVPVAGETFDLVATNPPFVISPATDERLVYRDSGLPGDRVVEDVVRGLPDHLAPGGWGQVLANWVVERDRPWDERLAAWLDPALDALVVQREVLDPAAYVELWLKDSGHHGGPDYRERYDTWLTWFDDQGIEAVGFGWVNLRRPDGARQGVHELLEWTYDVDQPVAPWVRDWARAVHADVDESTRLVLRPDVRQETVGEPGAEDPEVLVLRQQRGFRRARAADTVVAGLVGACDGDLPVGAILDAIAALLGADPAETRTTYLPVARELVAEGFLTVG